MLAMLALLSILAAVAIASSLNADYVELERASRINNVIGQYEAAAKAVGAYCNADPGRCRLTAADAGTPMIPMASIRAALPSNSRGEQIYNLNESGYKAVRVNTAAPHYVIVYSPAVQGGFDMRTASSLERALQGLLPESFEVGLLKSIAGDTSRLSVAGINIPVTNGNVPALSIGQLVVAFKVP